MTPDTGGAGHGGAPEDPDLGSPIAELRDVAMSLDDQFTGRVQRRIERRLLTGEFLELFWAAPLTMLLEFLRWPFDLFTDRRK